MDELDNIPIEELLNFEWAKLDKYEEWLLKQEQEKKVNKVEEDRVALRAFLDEQV